MRTIPREWWRPRPNAVTLLLITAVFWAYTVYQAIRVVSHGAPVISLFGLGGVYLVFTIVSMWAAIGVSIPKYYNGEMTKAEAINQFQAFVVLATLMLAGNVAVFAIYARTLTVTPVDVLTIAVDAVLLAVLIIVYKQKRRNIVADPIARGWIAIAGKTVPQLAMAALFVRTPAAAHGINPVTLAGILALSGLRLWPNLRVWWKNRAEPKYTGVVLGEGGNTLSGVLLSISWAVAVFLR